MCFRADATPPPVPTNLARAGHPPPATRAVLPADDGGRLPVAYALADNPCGPSVVILPDVRGLSDFYENLARQVAMTGHHAIVIDYYGRTTTDNARGPEFDFAPLIARTSPAQIQLDLRVAAAKLRELTGPGDLVTLGFCFGGSHSYLATMDRKLDLAGAISFYGGLDHTRLGVFPSPADHATEMRGPILAVFGGADASITVDLRERFDRALSDAGVAHEFVVYPDAPHSFFDRSHHSFAMECADAWMRVVDFLQSLKPDRSQAEQVR